MSDVAQLMVFWFRTLCGIVSLFPHTGRCVHLNMIQSPWRWMQHIPPKHWEQIDHPTQCKNPKDHTILLFISLQRCFISECFWPSWDIIQLQQFIIGFWVQLYWKLGPNLGGDFLLENQSSSLDIVWNLDDW